MTSVVFLCSPMVSRAAASRERWLGFYNLHTGEYLTSTYWVEGRYLPGALSEINFILRDFRTGEIKEIDVKLLDLLHALQAGMDSGEAFDVISGYRSPATNEMLYSQGAGVAKNSLHLQGKAVDISLPGRSLSSLRQAAIALKGGGVGYYPDSGFVHVDVGRVRTW